MLTPVTMMDRRAAQSDGSRRPVEIRIGCAGWQYRHWRGNFYPSELPTTRWLAYYADRFNSVEINNSFYRLPEAATFRAWRKRVPPGFAYSVKASRYLTHMKKLNEPQEPLSRLFSRARHLGPALAVVLYQLPPHWAVDLDRLRAFLALLPARWKHAIEFRDPSWYHPDIFAALDHHGVALCLHDMKGSATGRLDVGPFVYVRFHGPARYSGGYSKAHLEHWAEWLADRYQGQRSIFVYFNNDAEGHAPHDAHTLSRLLHERVNSL